MFFSFYGELQYKRKRRNRKISTWCFHQTHPPLGPGQEWRRSFFVTCTHTWKFTKTLIEWVETRAPLLHRLQLPMYQPLSQTNLVFTCPCFPELSIQTEVLSLPQQQDRIAEVLWSTRKVIYPNIWKLCRVRFQGGKSIYKSFNPWMFMAPAIWPEWGNDLNKSQAPFMLRLRKRGKIFRTLVSWQLLALRFRRGRNIIATWSSWWFQLFW